MQPTDYHEKIIQYYRDTENAYKDSWDLHNSLAIHYGYWDEKVTSFPQSLLRMNEVMMILKQFNCTVLQQEMQLFCVIKTGVPKNRLEETLYRLQELQNVVTKRIV